MSYKLALFLSFLFLSAFSLVHASRELQLTRRDMLHSVAKRIHSGNVTYTENSSVCETTPGVYHASGYVSTTANNHMVRRCPSLAYCLTQYSFSPEYSGSGFSSRGMILITPLLFFG